MTAELARMIQSGQLPEGARLPAERDLMQQFQVSRAAVREAIAALAHRGLVLTRLGHRPTIRRPDCEGAVDRIGGVLSHLAFDHQSAWALFETRVFFEAALARFAARHARRAHIEDLRAALDANRQAIGEAVRFDDTDRAFHGILYRIPGNPVFPAIHRAYAEWLVQHCRTAERGPEIDRMNFAGHQAVLHAIEARDADAAEEALRRHLSATWEFVRSIARPEP